MKIIETKFGTYMEREDDPTKLTGDKIKVFVERLKKIGIEVKLQGNFPWVYINEICGKRVTEKFEGNHGFTLIFLPFSNISASHNKPFPLVILIRSPMFFLNDFVTYYKYQLSNFAPSN